MFSDEPYPENDDCFQPFMVRMHFNGEYTHKKTKRMPTIEFPSGNICQELHIHHYLDPSVSLEPRLIHAEGGH
jgi:hypothetical protein